MELFKMCRFKRLCSIFKKILHLLLQIIVSVLLILPLVYLVVPIAIILIYIIRKSVTIFARIFKPKLGKILSTQSSVLGAEDTTLTDNFNIVVALQIKGNPPDLEKIRHDIEVNSVNAKIDKTGELSRYPELKQSIVSFMGFSFWSDVKNFKIEDHVYFWEHPETKSRDEKGLEIYPRISLKESQLLLDEFATKPWKPGRPLWEFIIIPGIIIPGDDEPRFFSVYRMHHALGDAYSIFKFLSRTFMAGNTMEKVAKPRFVKRNGLKLFYHTVTFGIKMPYELAGLLLENIVTRWAVPKQDVKNAKQLYSAHSPSISLDYLKNIKNLHGVDFTSLMFAAVVGGCREMIQKYHGKVPKEAKIISPFPIQGHPDKLRNHVAMAQIKVPIGEPDYIKRLHRVSNRILRHKNSTLPFMFYHLSHLAGALPASFIRFGMNKFKFPPMGITNVLAPGEQCFYCGKEMEDIYIVLNLSTRNTTDWWFMLITYNGKARLNVAGLSMYLPSSEHAEELLNLALKQLDMLSNTVVV